ncbi:HEAT repeat domain-containing protein [Acidobacteriota bacterium]
MKRDGLFRVIITTAICFMCLSGGLFAKKGKTVHGRFAPLVAGMQSEDQIERVKATQEFLRSLEASDIPYLVKLFNGENNTMRQLAMEGLYRVGDISVLDILIAALEDEDTYIKRKACDTLQRLEDPRAVPGLVKAVKGEDFKLREKSLEILETLARPEDTKLVLNLLTEIEDVRIKSQVIDLLGKLKDKAALPELKTLLSDKEPFMRAKGVEAIADIGGIDELDSLKPLFADENAYVKFAAMAAAASLGTKETLDLVKPHLKEIQEASDTYGMGMKLLLVELLGDLGDPSSADVILRAYQFDDGYGGRLTKPLRLAAVTALSKLEGKAGKKGLIAALSDQHPPVRLEAVKGLSEARAVEAIEPLKAMLLKEGDMEVAQTAKRLLDSLEKEAGGTKKKD